MIAKFKQTSTLTGVYQHSVLDPAEFKALVAALNQTRAKLKQPALNVGLPAWTPDQVMRDAVRGYNGWAGSDPVVPGLHLHEYRLGVDGQGVLEVTIQGAGAQAQATWNPVLPSERPAVGDPNYVEHVLAQQP